jgi:U2-associated protein SR140
VINLQDSSICGHQVRLSWSKACELPPVALPTLNTPSGWDAKPWEAAGVNPSVYAISASALKVVVQFPANARIQMAIDKMATLVHRRGYMFEQYVIDRESDSADFFFLTELDCAEHVFYRWRLHSLSQGDSLTKWRTTPFQFITGGAFWYPPPMPVIQVEKRDDKVFGHFDFSSFDTFISF